MVAIEVSRKRKESEHKFDASTTKGIDASWKAMEKEVREARGRGENKGLR